MIPEGTWRAKALRSGAKFGEASTGTEQVAVPFRFTDKDQEVCGQTIIYIGNFAAGQGFEITCSNLETAGWDGKDFRPPNGLAGLGDVEVDLVIEHEEYQGKWRAKIKFINAADGAGFKFKADLGAAALDDLTRRLHERNRRREEPAPGATGGSAPTYGRAPARANPAPVPRSNAAPPPAAEWDGTGTPPDDDIPF